MSTFQERIREARSRNSGELANEPDGFRQEFPGLADALIGVASGKDGDAIPAHTLMMFVREGRLRFSLSSQESDIVLFGEVADPSAGLSGVEACLASGSVGVKKDRQQKRR